MIRALTVSAILGELIAGAALYAVRSAPSQAATEASSGILELPADVEAVIANWPICSTTFAPGERTALIKALAEEAREIEYAKLHPKFTQTFGLGRAPGAE